MGGGVLFTTTSEEEEGKRRREKAPDIPATATPPVMSSNPQGGDYSYTITAPTPNPDASTRAYRKMELLKQLLELAEEEERQTRKQAVDDAEATQVSP